MSGFKRHLAIFVFFIALSCFQISFSQNISGVINSYKKVLGISGNTFALDDTIGLRNCSRVLIIQMKGAKIDTSNNRNFGTVLDAGCAGCYEFTNIIDFDGSNVIVHPTPTKAFDASGMVQLVTVPVYGHAVVSGSLTCTPWSLSNKKGGVLVLEADTLTLNENINVSERGFRGGAVGQYGFACEDSSWCGVLNGVGVDDSRGMKGEGIADYIFNKEGGRGKLANGGGGSNSGNSGGGGGGNYGQGGLGGFLYSECAVNNDVQGIGGQDLDFSTEKAFLGGGAGGGFRDNYQAVTPGKNGGGIIMLNCKVIIGNNDSILSNGAGHTRIADGESAGGGGAGGSILSWASSYVGPIVFQAQGGKGGSTKNDTQFNPYCHAPGGGGAGGVFWTKLNALPPNVSFSSTGGSAGLVLNPNSSCYNTSFGATKGEDGAVKYDLSPLQIIKPQDTTTIQNVCGVDSVVLTPNIDYYKTIEWKDGSNEDALLAKQANTYWVKTTNLCFTQIDTFKLRTILSIPKDDSICPGDSSLLAISANPNLTDLSYSWSPSSFLSSPTGKSTYAFPNKTTTYRFSIKEDSTGCIVNDSVSVFIDSLNVSFSVNIAEGNIPLLVSTTNSSFGAIRYSWNWGDSTEISSGFEPRHSYENSGSYIIKLTGYSQIGCIDTASYSYIKVNDRISIHIPKSFSPNNDNINDLFKVFSIGIVELTCSIYNRWGELLFYTTDIEVQWNGKNSFDNSIFPIGEYLYVIEAKGFDGSILPKKGSISLIR